MSVSYISKYILRAVLNVEFVIPRETQFFVARDKRKAENVEINQRY